MSNKKLFREIGERVAKKMTDVNDADAIRELAKAARKGAKQMHKVVRHLNADLLMKIATLQQTVSNLQASVGMPNIHNNDFENGTNGWNTGVTALEMETADNFATPVAFDVFNADGEHEDFNRLPLTEADKAQGFTEKPLFYHPLPVIGDPIDRMVDLLVDEEGRFFGLDHIADTLHAYAVNERLATFFRKLSEKTNRMSHDRQMLLNAIRTKVETVEYNQIASESYKRLNPEVETTADD